MIKKSDKIHHAHCHGVAVADVMERHSPFAERTAVDEIMLPSHTGEYPLAYGIGNMDKNPDIIFRDVAWTNNPYVIAQNPKVVSINS